jgi:hypothetical protein
MHWVRRFHLFSGLFLLPWVMLYGITAFLFNHPEAFPDQPVRSFGREEIAGTPLEQMPAASDAAARAVEALQARRKSGDSGPAFRLVNPEKASYSRDRIAANVTSGTEQHSVLVDVVSGTGTVRTRSEVASESPPPFAARSGVTVPGLPSEHVKEGLPAVLDRAGVSSGEVSLRVVPDLTFYMEADGQVWRVTHSPLRGSVTGQPADVPGEEMSFRSYLLRMHLAHGYPPSGGMRWWWAIGVDVMVGAMIFWALSGLFMWWQIKAVRWWGLATIICGVFVSGLLFSGMHQAFTP